MWNDPEFGELSNFFITKFFFNNFVLKIKYLFIKLDKFYLILGVEKGA